MTIIRIIVMSLCVAALTYLVYGCKTTGKGPYLQQSYIDPRRSVVYDDSGKDQGYIQKSLIDNRRYIQYDRKGKATGYWQKDYVDPRKTRFYKKK